MILNPVIIIAVMVCSISVLSILPDAEAKTWKVHIAEMPKQWESNFGNLYHEGTKYWEKQLPGTYFTEITQREKADFVVQWASQFQGNRLGYYTSSTNNEFGKPYIAITLGFMDDESVKWQDRKFHLVDAEYAKLITIHEIGHAIGFDHSTDPKDIMYPTIYNYDDWLRKQQPGYVETLVTQYNSKSIETQQEANSKVSEVKEYVYSKQDLLSSKHYESNEAQEKLDNAWKSLEEAKGYLNQAEWTQKEGESYLSMSDYEEAYFKYLHSVGMAKKVWDPIIEINKSLESAEEFEFEYQKNKSEQVTVQKIEQSQTCFLFWCW
jgi:hypothetical protein